MTSGWRNKDEVRPGTDYGSWCRSGCEVDFKSRLGFDRLHPFGWDLIGGRIGNFVFFGGLAATESGMKSGTGTM